MAEISPFKIETPDAVIDDLKLRLGMTRWPDEETPDDWSQGIPLSYMKEIHQYWLHDYDWKTREGLLNKWDGFKTEVEGLGIHFLHIKSHIEGAKPLILTHGWPGSIVEFQKVIGPLTDPLAHGGSEEDAFHLVCPTLPGYGFSDKPDKSPPPRALL